MFEAWIFSFAILPLLIYIDYRKVRGSKIFKQIYLLDDLTVLLFFWLMPLIYINLFTLFAALAVPVALRLYMYRLAIKNNVFLRLGFKFKGSTPLRGPEVRKRVKAALIFEIPATALLLVFIVYIYYYQ